MSQRMLVELNCDYLADIESNPEQFVAAMVQAIRAGGYWDRANDDPGFTRDAHANLRSNGGAIVGQRHHSHGSYFMSKVLP